MSALRLSCCLSMYLTGSFVRPAVRRKKSMPGARIRFLSCQYILVQGSVRTPPAAPTLLTSQQVRQPIPVVGLASSNIRVGPQGHLAKRAILEALYLLYLIHI